jgi:CheY-like chemotaxis protein
MPRLAIVVDDSMLIRHTVCRYFEQRGVLVESATNGAEALEILQCITPDIIVTDLQMPRMTGSELITAVKSRPETANVPVIVLAGRSTAFDPIREHRANAVIFKDIDIIHRLDVAVSEAIPEVMLD